MTSVILHPTGAETISGIGDSFTVYNDLVGIFVNVSAIVNGSDDAVLNFQLQQSPNGMDWYDVSGINITGIADVGLYEFLVENPQLLTDTVRIVWTISGTMPSFTFEVEIVTE